MALFTEDAVVAKPAVLVSLSYLFRTRKAVWMETLAAKVTTEELFP
jgi:hypothetical protein